ncbi:hypothetical protein Aspvir_005004 [Aspergillus viridinutans]|uniref:Uncharacterized protein n=1 Tax=Aspergillus viridinutans TaxID=75553 RepID=A0A9P3F125_ASPVI|nr:uncharacterized protein Aspvir_005004 [Aspergillus viridinutans]GIK00974.1 hypothetical protein Aspvir_005004 [Aspergillus viridinutans]
MSSNSPVGSFQFLLEKLEFVFKDSTDAEPFALKADDIKQCYDRVEQILAGLLIHYNIHFDTERRGSTHRYHDNLISAFQSRDTPREIREPLGTGPIQGVLFDGKSFRNKHKEFKEQRLDEGGLRSYLATMVNGLPLVIKALRKACENAKVMLVRCPANAEG